MAISQGVLGHFFWNFPFWTQNTLKHSLGLILVISEICQFIMTTGLFEYFSEEIPTQKSFLNEGVTITPPS